SEGGLALGIAAAAGYAFLALGLLTLDRFRASSTSKDDGQLELKVLIFALALIGLTLVADGAAGLLGMVLGGFKGAGDAIKQALAIRHRAVAIPRKAAAIRHRAVATRRRAVVTRHQAVVTHRAEFAFATSRIRALLLASALSPLLDWTASLAAQRFNRLARPSG